MACRLNPNFKQGLSDLGLLIIIATCTVGALTIYSAICVSIPYYFSMWTDSYAWLAYLSDTRTCDTLSDYVFYCSARFMFALHLFGAMAAVILTILYSLFKEAVESYQVKRYQSAYKFQGKPLPWYRILISYIIICDK